MNLNVVFIISTAAMILSLLGNLLMTKKNMLVFPVWIVSNILWILVNFLGAFNAPMVLMYLIYIAIQSYGWLEWKKES